VALPKKLWEGTTIITIIAVFSLVVAIVSVVVQLRTKTLKLNCNVLSSNELTSVSEVPGLSSQFTYNKKKVAHLWKVTLNYINSGNETLVGVGQHSSLIGDGLSFSFPSQTEILNYELISNDLPITIDQFPPNGFKVKFSQWKPDEKATISLYVTSSSAQTSPLIPSATRDIVGGTIIITNAIDSTDSKRRSLMDRLPIGFAILIKTILSLFCLLVFFLAFYFFPIGLIGLMRRRYWTKYHLSQFKTFLQSQSDLTDGAKKNYLKEPRTVPEDIWTKFQGHRYPREASPSFDILSEAIIFTAGFLLLGAILVIYVLTNILDLYYAVHAYFTAV
jgi:hypothetical protein